MANYLDQWLPGRSRVPALAIVYLSLVILLFVIGIEIGSRVVSQANALATRVPEILSKLEQVDKPIASPSVQSIKETVISTMRKQLVDHSRDILSLLPNAALDFLFLSRVPRFQDYVLSPQLLSAGTEFHALVVIFGFLAGGQIAGITGCFLSVPVVAILRIIYRQMQKKPLDPRLQFPRVPANCLPPPELR